MEQRIECRAILELLGKPKEYIEKTAGEIVEGIKRKGNYTVQNTFLSDVEAKEHLFAQFIEIEFSVGKLEHVFDFCFDYMPSSIEFLSPESMTMTAQEMTYYLSDLQTRLHTADMVTKKLNGAVQFLRSNVYKLIKNMVTLLLRNNELDADVLAKHSGIGKAELQKFLDRLVDEKHITRDGEKYSLIR